MRNLAAFAPMLAAATAAFPAGTAPTMPRLGEPGARTDTGRVTRASGTGAYPRTSFWWRSPSMSQERQDRNRALAEADRMKRDLRAHRSEKNPYRDPTPQEALPANVPRTLPPLAAPDDGRLAETPLATPLD